MQTTWCFAFALLVGTAQGSVSDLVHAAHGKQMTLPTFASLFQNHLGEDSSKGHAHQSGWKKQAQVFLGLLQGMGSQVPSDKADQTRSYIDEIIKLLTTPRDDIFSDAETTKRDTEQKLKGFYDTFEDADKKAEKVMGDVETINEQLKVCYGEIDGIETTHGEHCGVRDRPISCTRMDDTRKHKFDVSSKFTWQCNYAEGSTPETCTDDSSPLSTDLTKHNSAMKLAYEGWKLEKKACTEALQRHKDECTNTNNTLISKKADCDAKRIDGEDHLCVWREWIQKRIDALTKLEDGQTEAPTLLPPKKKEWTDLNLIICMLKTFRDRQNMTFMEDDYSTCEAEAAARAWVGGINILETETKTVKDASKYTAATLNFAFTAGLAEYYLGSASMSVEFFTTPKAESTAALYAQLAQASDGKKLPASCSGYTVISTADAEGDCSASAACKYYDLSSASAHSVSATCALESGSPGAMVAKKVCSAGLRLTELA